MLTLAQTEPLEILLQIPVMPETQLQLSAELVEQMPQLVHPVLQPHQDLFFTEIRE